jgi:aspartate aminotransferase
MDNPVKSSKILANVQPSATFTVTQKARDLRAQGIDVIALGAGEPDFDTPEHIKRAAKEAISQGRTKYTAVDGIAELKAAIQAKLYRDNGLKYELNQISVAPGGKPVIYNAFRATLNAGDEVIIPCPSWVSYPEIVRLCGAQPVLVSCGQEQGYKLNAEQLERAITPHTKWLILNSPSNPTGAVYRDKELGALGEVLKKHPHIMVLSDDIYEHIIYDNQEFNTLPSIVPELQDRTLIVNGVSKAYAMTGWRIGYGAGPQELIALMAKFMAQTTSNATSISQWAAVAALNGPHDFIAKRNSVFKERRDYVVAALNAADGLSCDTPKGAFYVFPNCSGLIGKTSAGGHTLSSDLDVVTALLNEKYVAVVPGSAFHAPSHFRISYATDMTSLKTACTRLGEFCAGAR